MNQLREQQEQNEPGRVGSKTDCESDHGQQVLRL